MDTCAVNCMTADEAPRYGCMRQIADLENRLSDVISLFEGELGAVLSAASPKASSGDPISGSCELETRISGLHGQVSYLFELASRITL